MTVLLHLRRLAKVKQPRKATFKHVWFIQEPFTLELRFRLSGGHWRRVIDLIDLSSDPRLILLTSDPFATRVNSQDKDTPLVSWWSGEINHSSGSQVWMSRSRTSSTSPGPRSDLSPASLSVNHFLSLWIRVCTGPYPISPLISLLGMEGVGESWFQQKGCRDGWKREM